MHAPSPIETGYFYIHNRMPSALFDTLEHAEDSAETSINPICKRVDSALITFYQATCRNGKMTIKFIQTWYGD